MLDPAAAALDLILPTWAVPKTVRAFTTTRHGGVSIDPYDSFNLGDHVGDDPARVRANRLRLRAALPGEPRWLTQVHGIDVVDAAHAASGATADGSYTDRRGVVCAILTADCLPIFLSNRQGTKVGALHAGWRGLAGGIVEAGVRAMNVPGAELLAWLGPSIGPAEFEVGDEVCRAFVDHDAGATEAFVAADHGKWHADLHRLAARRLRALGVVDISGDAFCTLRETDKFFSFRRDGVTGRMASLIWME